MQISIKLFRLMLLCCFTQPIYSSIEPQRTFFTKSQPHLDETRKLINFFMFRNIPKQLTDVTADQKCPHQIIVKSIDMSDEEPFPSTATVVTTWHTNLLHTTNPEHKVTVERSMPHIPENNSSARFFETTSNFTFITATGGTCHADFSGSTIVFDQNSTPKKFDAIPCLKGLLTCLLSYPVIFPVYFDNTCISINGTFNEDEMLTCHIKQIETPRCSYAHIEELKKN